MFSFNGSIRKRVLSSPKLSRLCKISYATAHHLRSTEPTNSFCTNCNRKVAILLWRCIKPCPPSSFGRNNTFCGTQCNLSQTKSTRIAWILVNSCTGGSTQANLCHNEDATKLLIIKIRPLYDIFGTKHFHLFRRPLTFSMTPSQFFCTVNSSPKNTPKYLKPNFPQIKPSGSSGFPCAHLPNNNVFTFTPVYPRRR